jgi:hypothetical protein
MIIEPQKSIFLWRTSLMYAAEPLSRADIYVDATNGKFF